MMYDDYLNNLEPEKPRRSRLKTFAYLVIVVALILGLMWSGIASIMWLVNRPQTETAVLTPPTLSPPTLSPPTLSPPSSTLAAPTRDLSHVIDRIAFINPAGSVETISPDGDDRREISDSPARFQFPGWSPTGEYVAAVGGSSLVRFTDSTEMEAKPVYTNRSQSPFYFYWSPDGSALSFLANHPGGIGLHLAPVDGDGEESRLLEVGSPFYWDWTADSDQILIHSGFSGDEARLALIDVADGSTGPNVAMPGLFQAPDISWNGRYWGYAELDENGISWLVAADSQTGDIERQRHAGLVALNWSPVTDQLAFITAAEEGLNFAGPLRLMDAATGETQLLSRDVVFAFFWSPDGRYIAAITGNEGGEGVIAKGNGRDHMSKSAAQSHPAITLNLMIIDVFSGESRDLLTFQPTVMFVTQFLPFFDQYALSHRIWSPDSQAVVLSAIQDDNSHILVIPINGDQPQKIAEGDMPFWSHQ